MTPRALRKLYLDLADRWALHLRKDMQYLDKVLVDARERKIDLPETFMTMASEFRALHKRAERAVTLACEALGRVE